MSRALTLADVVPDPDVLLALDPEEVGFAVLRVLATVPDDEPAALNRSNFFGVAGAAAFYPRERQDEVRAVLPEGWAWLEREGLVVPDPGRGTGWMRLSRRGRKLAAQTDLRAYHQAHLLPRASLHAALLSVGVDASFIRGDFDTAVFQAFKALEVRVRVAAGLGPDDIGVNLMRKAFHETTGPLRLSSDLKAEREALMSVMAGAIALYKNPQSHREVGIADASEAAEIVLFASHLLRTVDRLAARSAVADAARVTS